MAAISQVAGATLPAIITPAPPRTGAFARPSQAHLDPQDQSLTKRNRAAKSDARGNETQDGKSRRQASQELSEEEQQKVVELKARDREVRAHEQAHKNAGGPYASAPTYEFTRGPDGNQYAISGEVSIDASPVAGNASATIAKMEVVIRAALAPAEPSGQDMKVASQARATKTKAQIELRQEKSEESTAGFAELRERLGLEDSVDGLTPAKKAAKAYQSLEDLLQPQSGSTISFAA